MRLTSINHRFFVLPLLLALGTLQGCASTSDLTKTKAVADQALQTAQHADQSAAAANSAAKAADQKADSAMTKADQADQKADTAITKADQALQEIKDLNEKVDRMFKKSMKK